MRLILTFILPLAFITAAISQSLPAQWRISEDGKILIAGDQASVGLYDESTVEDIRIYFNQPNYWSLMTQNYESKTDIPCQIKYKNTVLDSVGIRFKGQTSYFMNNTQKKSFNLSIDVYKDQQLEGYKTMNLNNAWQDPSFMREVLYYQLVRKYTSAPKANFVHLYINDQDWGIYLNVQQLNKDFLKEWYASNDGINMRADAPDGIASSGGGGPGGGPGGGGQWGDGTAALNYLGADTALYQKYYTLKSNDGKENPWNELMNACNVLNNSGASLETEAPKVFNIDNILWHLAIEIAFADDDSYVYKGKMDYYLYKDPETHRWQTYDYDANSVMATNNVTWSAFYNENKVNYPLLNKLLAVPAFRQRYLAHLRTIITNLMDETKVNALIDKNNTLISAAVMADTKKATSNAAYTNGLTTLKNFIKNRKTNLLNNAEVKAAAPVISNARYMVNNTDFAPVSTGDRVAVSANVSYTSGIQKVNIHYCAGFSGLFTELLMHDNGQNGDVTANDGEYAVLLPKFEAGILVRFYIEAVGANTVNSRSYFPAGTEHQVMVFTVEAKVSSDKTVVINEFMASNVGIIKDVAGENEDWIELYNTSDKDVDLSGYFITDNPDNLTKFEFPAGTVLKAKDYLIIWADEDQEQGPLHSNFKLSAGGEVIILLDKLRTIVDSIQFGQQTTDRSAARIPNGTGPFVIGNHTLGKHNQNLSDLNEWQPSMVKIYPNPSTGTVTIKNGDNHTSKMTIFHSNGTLTNHYSVEANQEISISDLLPGLYILKTQNQTLKLVVLHQ